MKTISKLALAAVLATGMSGAALVAPAAAKDKKDDGKDGLKLTPAVQKPAAAAQTAIGAQDFATAETQLATAEAAAASASDDDKYIVAALRYDLEARKMLAQQTANPNAPVDQSVLVKPLDAMLANPKTPAASRGQLLYRRGTIAFSANQPTQAAQYLEQARQAGYKSDDLDLQIAKVKLDGPDVRGGLTELSGVIDAQSAAGKKAPESYYKFGLARANAAKLNPETLVWLKKWIAAYPTPKNWHDVAFIYGIQQGSVAKLDTQQEIDLWRLLRAAHALADQSEYREYAGKVYRALPSEAKSVLNEGMASGKLTGSADAKQLLAVATTALRSEPANAVLETRAKAGANGSLAAQTGDSYLGQDNYPKAAELYRLALQKGGVNADEVNTRLGIALAKSGDKAGAKAAFDLVKGAPRSDIAALWTTWMENPPAA